MSASGNKGRVRLGSFLLFFLGTGALAASVFLLYRPLTRSEKALYAENKVLQEENNRLQVSLLPPVEGQEGEDPDKSLELQQLEGALELIKDQVPDAVSEEDIIEACFKFGDRRGLEIVQVVFREDESLGKLSADEPYELFSRNVDIYWRGTEMGMKALTEELDEGSPVMALKGISYDAEDEGGRLRGAASVRFFYRKTAG